MISLLLGGRREESVPNKFIDVLVLIIAVYIRYVPANMSHCIRPEIDQLWFLRGHILIVVVILF